MMQVGHISTLRQATGTNGVGQNGKSRTSLRLTSRITGDGVTDDTVAIQKALAYSESSNHQKVDFVNCSYKITNTIRVGYSGCQLYNGTLIQHNNSSDVILIKDNTSANNLFNISFKCMSFWHNTPSNAQQGCLIRQQSTIGYFLWEGNGSQTLSENGFQGFRSEAPLYLSEFKGIWINDSWAEGFWIPSGGGLENSITISPGGSTTLTFKNCFITSIKEALPGFRLASGHSDIYIENCATDKCHEFGVFRMANSASLKIINCHMEDPSYGGQNRTIAPGLPHSIITLGASYGNVVDGFVIAFSDTNSHSTGVDNSTFLNCNGNCQIKNVAGGLPSNYSFVNVQEYSQVKLEGCGRMAEYGTTGNGYIKLNDIDNPKGNTPGSGKHKLFTVPPDYYSSWMITTSWAYLGSSQFNTWIVSGSTNNGMYEGFITPLQIEGVGQKNTSSLSIEGQDIFMTHTNGTNSRWTATRLDIGNRI